MATSASTTPTSASSAATPSSSVAAQPPASSVATPAAPTWLCPTYPPFYGEVGEAAVNGQIVTYPNLVRSQIDFAVQSQSYGLFTMMLFAEPKKTRAGKYVYGFAKLRGNYADESQARAAAASIVRNQDSKNTIRIIPVGQLFPITDDPALIQDTVDVGSKAEDEKKELERKAIQEKAEERVRIQRELKEREEEVKNARDYNEDPDSLDYYTMQRNTWMMLRENIAIEEKKLESLKNKWADRRRLLAELDSKHPTYDTAWIEHLNVERRKSGFPDFVPGEKDLEAYRATSSTVAATPATQPPQ